MTTNATNLYFPNVHLAAHPRTSTDEFIDVLTSQSEDTNRLDKLITSGSIDPKIFFFDSDMLLLSIREQKVISSCKTLIVLFERIRRRSTLEHITLEHCCFTEESWKTLCMCLQSIPVKTLKVHHCRLNNHGVKRLMQSLASQSQATLQELSLDDNEITAAGIPYIGDFMRAAPLLSSLSLEHNAIDNVSVLALTQSLQYRVAPLDVSLAHSWGEVSHSSVKCLLQRTRCIRHLNLNGNRHIEGIKIFKNAIAHKSLTRLSVRGTRMSDAVVLRFLSKDEKIRECIKKNRCQPQGNKIQIDFTREPIPNRSGLVHLFSELPVNLSVEPVGNTKPLKQGILQSHLDEVLNLPAAERQAAFERILEKRFERTDIPLTPDCIFTCLSILLINTPAQWRQLLVHFVNLQDNADFVQALLMSLEDPPTIEEYTHKITAGIAPGGPIELELFSQLFLKLNPPRSIIVFNLERPPSIENNELVPCITLCWGNRTHEPIYLYQKGPDHYQPLKKRYFESN